MARNAYDPMDEDSSEFEPSVLTSWNGGTGYHTTGYGAMSGYAPPSRTNRRGARAWGAAIVTTCIEALRRLLP